MFDDRIFEPFSLIYEVFWKDIDALFLFENPSLFQDSHPRHEQKQTDDHDDHWYLRV